MSVFVFDDNTIGMIRYILAIQRFNEYSVGPQELNQYLCALSFEKVLIQTGLKYPKFQKETPSEISIHAVIRFLQQKNLIPPTVANKLEDFLDFHTSLMFNYTRTSPEKARDKAREILQFLCIEAGLNQDYEIKNRTFEEIANHRTNASLIDSELVESDFDSLDQLYMKCPLIQREIEKRLTTPLKGAKLSGFTPNAGGIWLPFVTCEPPDKREPIDRASIGVAFTPIDIRIGVDFGSQAHKSKIRYYELLLNGELIDYFEVLNRKATGYCFCDTFWYYHVRNIQSLQWCLTLYGSTKATIERAIEETKQLEGTTLTANRYLISKVIHRRPEDFTYIIQGLVNEISKVLDELYPILERIKKNSCEN